jgi:ABC-type nitrate/sulfonate/bicarbonate transport system ATPase subunit
MLIQAKGLVKHWQSRSHSFKLGPIDFRLGPGDTILVTGTNGSGKSTLLNCLARLLHIDDGSISWHNSLTERDVLMMHQNYHSLCLPWYTCLENLLLARSSKETDSENSWEGLLLPPILKKRLHAPAYKLSGGEKQAMIMCQLLLAHRRVLLLDEPFSNMDIGTVEFFAEILKTRCLNEKNACVIASHDHPTKIFKTSHVNLVDGQLKFMQDS